MNGSGTTRDIYHCSDCGCWSTELIFWHDERQTCGSCLDARHAAVPTTDRAHAREHARKVNTRLQVTLDRLIDAQCSPGFIQRTIAKSRNELDPGW